MAKSIDVIFSQHSDLIVEVHTGTTKETKRESSPDEQNPVRESESTHRFFVISAILATVSPVWEKSLDQNGSFQRLKTTSGPDGRHHRILPPQEVDPVALRLVLTLLHHQYENVPESVDFELLRNISILADRYDFAGSISHFVGHWIAAILSDPSHDPLLPGHEDWLLVESTFPKVNRQGLRSVCADITTCLIQEIAFMDNGDSQQTMRRTLRIYTSEDKYSPIINPQERNDQSFINWSNKISDFDFESHIIDVTFIPRARLDHILKVQSQKRDDMIDLLIEFSKEVFAAGHNFDSPVDDNKNIPKGISAQNFELDEVAPTVITFFCKNNMCTDIGVGSFRRSLNRSGLVGLWHNSPSRYKNLSVSELSQRAQTLNISSLTLKHYPDSYSYANHGNNGTINLGYELKLENGNEPVSYSHKKLVLMSDSDKTSLLICPRATKLLEIQKELLRIHTSIETVLED